MIEDGEVLLDRPLASVRTDAERTNDALAGLLVEIVEATRLDPGASCATM